MKVIQLERFHRGKDEHVILPYESGSDCDCLHTVLPWLEKCSYLYLDTCGGYTDIFTGNECIDTANGKTRKLTGLDGRHGRELKFRFITGGTFLRSASVFTTNAGGYILPYGLYASVKETDGKFAIIEITADLENDNAVAPFELEVAILNKRGKRITARKKKLTLKPGKRTVKLDLKLRSVMPYSQSDPYMYTVTAKLTGHYGEDEASAKFAVRGDLKDAINGTFISPNDGVIGGISTVQTEKYRLNALKTLGYNTVRFNGCPTDAALTAADELGLKCIVDIFDNWSQPKGNTLAHVDFKIGHENIIRYAVRSLRSHPSVIMYSVGNCVEESYGRANPAVMDEIITVVKEEDDSRFITAALGELVPTPAELEDAGVPEDELLNAGEDSNKLIELARRADLFNIKTEPFALQLDIVGLSDVSAEGTGSGKPVFFAATSPEKAHDFAAEFDRADDILGDISDIGIAKERGDLDETYCPAVTGLYRKVVKGEAGAFIGTSSLRGAYSAARHWDGYAPGEKVYIYVYANADVVALYLNGKLIGRKLAGKVNDYIATFKTEYSPGSFEAVCFAGGKETERCYMKSSGKSYGIKLDAPKSVPDGEIAAVSVNVTDNEGNAVFDTGSEITVSVQGGETVRIGNSLGEAGKNNVCALRGGSILVLVRPHRGTDKIVVTAEGEKLKRGRATIKIK